jgi:hypothetical protein
MLDPISRGAIVGSTALCLAAAVALAPTVARSAISPLVYAAPDLPRINDDAADTTLPIGRDPFAAPAPSAAPAVASPAPLWTPSATLGVPTLPSNLAEDAIPLMPGATSPAVADGTRVTAVVTGSPPYAIIERSGRHDIKGIGDRIGQATIVGIDLAGVRLSDGTRLPLDPAATR